MDRFDLTHQTSPFATRNVSSLDASSATPAGRLIVLVPADLNYGAAIQRIWQLAIATGKYVYLLGVCEDMLHELSLRRQLIAMSALLRDSRIPVEVKIQFATSWVDAVQTNYQADDIIVCFAEQGDEFLNKPLPEVLEENFSVPIFILSGLYTERSSRLSLLSHFLFWAGLLGIIAGAFVLQIRIMSWLRDWSQTTFMLLSTLAEFWLIWAWNNLFS